MIRFFRALAWLRWRILINGMKTRRRDTFEQLARVGKALAPLMFALLLVPSTLLLAGAAGYGGWWMGRRGMDSLLVTGVARFVLFAVLFAVVLAPVVRSVQGLRVSLTRLLLLPVPRRTLHVAEVLSGVADPWVVAVVPALLALPLGLIAAGAWGAGLMALLGGLALLGVLATLGSLGSYVAMLVFRQRRRAERLTLVLLVLLPLIGFVPGIFESRIKEEKRAERAARAAAERQAPPPPAREGGGGERAGASTGGDEDTGYDDEVKHEIIRQLKRAVGWSFLLPSELYGHALGSAADGRHLDAAARIGGLGLIATLLFAGSAATHRRLLEEPGGGSARRRGAAGGLPRLAPAGPWGAVGLIAAVHARTVLRTVRGKAAVFLMFAIVVLIYLVLQEELRLMLPGWPPLGPLMLLAGGAFTFLSIQPALLNVFAVDGAGLSLQALAPISDRQLVLGKIAGCGALAAISLGLCLASSLVVARDGHPLYWVAVLLACVSTYLLLAPAAAALSALFPVSVDLNRMGKAGNPHPIAGLLGVLFTALALLPPAALLLLGFVALRAPWITVLALAAWTGVAAVLAVPLVGVAVQLVAKRRENLLLVAAGR